MAGRLLEEEAKHLEGVVDLGGQVEAVLEADLARRPLEMDEDPAVHVLAIGTLELDGQLSFGRLGAGTEENQAEGKSKEEKPLCFHGLPLGMKCGPIITR